MSRRMPKVWVPREWYPECAQRYVMEDEKPFPPAGSVIGYARGVWRVTASRYLTEIEWNDADRERYRSLGQRDRLAWRWAPYRVEVEFVGGILPDAFKASVSDAPTGALDVHADRRSPDWWVYPHGRWPRCSCCGEPMPCRAELTDLRVDAGAERFEELASRLPGCCWGCGEPVTRRQKTVRYVGDNLDLPGGPAVVFHARSSCHYAASKYEERWLKANPSRSRIITYPKCPASLYWHADGSSECGSGHPDCQGHRSHQHGHQAGCGHIPGGCPRGCVWPKGQSYCNPKRVGRPLYRDPDLPQGDITGVGVARSMVADLFDGGGDPQDGRPTCPGDLLVHKDGTRECIAGGLGDCWGGDTYRHARHRDCQAMSHGCPRCETYQDLT